MKRATMKEGDRFGKWTVRSQVPFKIRQDNGKRRYCVVCLHDNGTIAVRTIRQVRNQSERKDRKDKLYNKWMGMMHRCYYKRDVSYCRYGAKGISVCKRWHKWPAFQRWALKHGYQEGLSLDRINNAKGYCPSNCRFVTWSEQLKNRDVTKCGRKHPPLTIYGETKTVAEWVKDKRCEVCKGTLLNRIRNGVAPEQALMQNKSLLLAFGERKSLVEWAKDARCEYSYTHLAKRYKVMPLEQAMIKPVKIKKVKKPFILPTAFGESKTYIEWGKDSRAVVSGSTIGDRVRRGWALEDAITIPCNDELRKAYGFTHYVLRYDLWYKKHIGVV